MKTIKLLCAILIVAASFQQSQAEENYEAWKAQALAEVSTAPIDEAGTMTFAYRDYSQPVRDLSVKRLNELSGFIADHNNDPQLWYLKGWITRETDYIYTYDLQQKGVSDFSKDAKAQAMLEEFRSYFRKALDLDEAPDAPAHLTREMLATMADNVLSPPDIKQRALKKELEIANAGTQPVDNPNYEWETFEFLLGSYAEQKDYDKYLETVNEMMERFPDSSRMSELVEYKRQAEAAIEKRMKDLL